MYKDTKSQNSPEPYTQQEDATLLILIQEGDEHAMALLYDRYSRVVYSVHFEYFAIRHQPRMCCKRCSCESGAALIDLWHHGGT